MLSSLAMKSNFADKLHINKVLKTELSSNYSMSTHLTEPNIQTMWSICESGLKLPKHKLITSPDKAAT